MSHSTIQLFEKPSENDAKVVLRDREIRGALREHLMRRNPVPFKIIEELGVHNGNAKADLVAMYKEMHCYEIKGATDSIGRVVKQASFFDEAFPRVSLVTTSNHLKWCSENLPSYWGLLLADNSSDRIFLRYVRSAKNSPRFVKKKALMMLWKEELKNIALETANIRVKSSYSREDLAEHVSAVLDKNTTISSIRRAISGRLFVNGVADVSDMTS